MSLRPVLKALLAACLVSFVAPVAPLGAEIDTPKPDQLRNRISDRSEFSFSTEDDPRVGRRSGPSELLEANGGGNKPAAWMATVGQMLERQGLEVANPVAPSETSSETDSAEVYYDGQRDVLAIGDADGDGLDDLAMLQSQRTGDTYVVDVVIKRGTDGAQLSRRTLPSEYALAVAVGDLSGDGAADILALSLDVSSSTVGGCFFVCAIKDDSTWKWTTELISGADGSTVWEQITPGGVHHIAGHAVIARAESFEATAVLVMPFLGADRNADGTQDVVVNVVDGESESIYGFLAGWDDDETRTTATVRSGSDGALLTPPLGVGWHAALSWLVPGGQATGDETPDLLWLEEIETGPRVCALFCLHNQTARARLVDGSTYAEVWTATAPDYSEFTPLTEDADEDGFDDILLFDGWDYRVSMISGVTGSALWTRPGEAGFPLGSLDEETGPDVVTVNSRYRGSYEFTFDRIDGGAGDVISTTTREIAGSENESVYGQVSLVGDADGDGIQDIGIALEHYNYITDRQRTSALVESSRTGNDVAATPPVSGWLYELVDAGDLDGDGRDDIVVTTYSYEEEAWLRIAAGSANGSLWVRSHSFDYWDTFRARRAGNLSSSQAGAVAINWSGYESASGSYRSGVEAVQGATGEHIWFSGDPLGGSQPNSGTISGTVLDANANYAEGVCVSAYDDMGTAVEGNAATGVFELLVPEGSYKLFVEDCSGRYGGATTWYELKNSFAEADAVTVHAGDVTDIIVSFPASVAPPAHDALADAAPLTTGSTELSTAGATLEAGEPQPCGGIGATVWLRYTAPSTGVLALTTAGSSFDTVLAVHHGTNIADLETIACNDDTLPDYTSAVAVDVVSGTTYFVQVGGYYGDSGDLVLSAVIG